ncbi:MAG: hypothetical protein AAFW64_11570 [Pseudomonadota bacterium]
MVKPIISITIAVILALTAAPTAAEPWRALFRPAKIMSDMFFDRCVAAMASGEEIDATGLDDITDTYDVARNSRQWISKRVHVTLSYDVVQDPNDADTEWRTCKVEWAGGLRGRGYTLDHGLVLARYDAWAHVGTAAGVLFDASCPDHDGWEHYRRHILALDGGYPLGVALFHKSDLDMLMLIAGEVPAEYLDDYPCS